MHLAGIVPHPLLWGKRLIAVKKRAKKSPNPGAFSMSRSQRYRKAISFGPSELVHRVVFPASE